MSSKNTEPSPPGGIPEIKLNEGQLLAIKSVKLGNNVFITGDPGTGKSFILKYLVENVLPKDGTTFVVAPTGIAALNAGGSTIHSFAGIGLGKGPPELLRKKMSEIGYNNIKMCKILIFDEISMVSAAFLEKIDYLCRRIKLLEKLPFGGIQILIFGDFHQLPPVFDKPTEVGETIDTRLVFESHIWQELNFINCQLTEIIRQKDPKYIVLLKKVKYSNLDSEAIKQLQDLNRPIVDTNGIQPTKLYSKNIDVTKENEDELVKLPQPQNVYECVDTTVKPNKEVNMVNHCVAPNKLYLRIGAQVMLIKNMKDDRNLVNGSRGIVTGFTEDGKLPIVQFLHIKRTIEWNVWELKNSQGKKIAQREQIPLKLAWSTTIHKCVTADTIIFTENGLQRIEDISKYQISRSLPIIQPNETSVNLNINVYGLDGINKANQIYKGKIEDTIILKTSLGYNIEGSYKHPILVYRDSMEQWVKLPDIKIGDYIIMNCGTKSASKNTIKIDDYKKTHIIPNEIDTELCYLLGLLTGGGSYCSKYIIDYVTEDEQLLEIFLNICSKQFGLNNNIKVIISDTTFRTYFCSQYIRDFLEYCGLGYSKGNNKDIPWCVLQNTIECQIAYLQGLFDTDGGINKSCVYFTNISEKLINNTQIMLLNLGIISSKVLLINNSDKNHEQAYRIQLCGQSARQFLKIVGFRLKRKQDALIIQYKNIPETSKCQSNNFPDNISKSIFKSLQSAINFERRDDTKFYSFINSGNLGYKQLYYDQIEYIINKCNKHSMLIPDKLNELYKRKIFYEKITDITYNKSQVYDISVPNGHSFIANGIFNHNSQGLTIDFLEVDISDVFVSGMAFTCLSRGTHLEGLYVKGFSIKKITTDTRVKKFYSDINGSTELVASAIS